MAAVIVPKKFPWEDDTRGIDSTKEFHLTAALFHDIDDFRRCAA
jgi:hypothetical protein